MRSHKRRLVLIFILVITVLMAEASFAYDNITVHPYIAQQGIIVWLRSANDEAHKQMKIYTGKNNLTLSDYDKSPNKATLGNSIIEGSVEEDYYDPREKMSFTGLWPPKKGLTKEARAVFDHHFYDVGWEKDNYKGLDHKNLGAINQARYYWDTYVIPSYKENGSSTSYYFLGRVAHLLADMSVPAHVKNDAHIVNKDSYEDYFTKDYGVNFARNYYNWIAGVAKISDPIPESWNLEKIFMNLASKAYKYPSDGTFGKINDKECAEFANKLMPLAIQHTAALFRRFWNETHMTKYEYTFNYGKGGDSYKGYFYSDINKKYAVGNLISKTDENGAVGYYKITKATEELLDSRRLGDVYVSAYHDGEANRDFAPLNAGKPLGYNYLGSENGYIVEAGIADHRFGYYAGKFYEADLEAAPKPETGGTGGSVGSKKYPNFVVSSLTLDHKKYYLGEEIDLVAKVKNKGAGDPTTDIGLAYYLSDGKRRDSDPVKVGDDNIKAANLKHGASKTETDSFSAPKTPGVYNVTARVDYKKKITEEHESDNYSDEAVFTVYARPEYTISDIYLKNRQALVPDGEQLTVFTDIYNAGGDTIRDIRVGYYLAANNDFNKKKLIGTSLIKEGNLDSRTHKLESYSFKAPTDSGLYTLWARVDDGGTYGKIKESNEGNNWSKSCMFFVFQTPKPNLVVNPISFGDNIYTYYRSQTLEVYAQVRNTGNAVAPAGTRAQLLLAPDEKNPTYHRWAEYVLGELKPGELATVKFNAVAPASKEHFLARVEVDYTKIVAERLETDNISGTLKFTVRTETPDLVMTGTHIKDRLHEVYTNQPIEVYSLVQNIGKAPSYGNFKVGLYLSHGDSPDTNPNFWGDLTVSALQPGESRWLTFITHTPTGTGKFNFVTRADIGNVVREKNEGKENQSISFDFTVKNLPPPPPDPATSWLNFTNPTPGEEWDTDKEHTVRWNYAGLNASHHVMISYSLNDGANWYTLVNNTPNDGSKRWYMDENPFKDIIKKDTDYARLKISCLENPAIYDISDRFKIDHKK